MLQWPELSTDEAAHTAAVADHLHGRIAATGGWIPFSEYMNEVLYAPGLGYYVAGARKFGQDGDFVTAPELSPLFGRCLARQQLQIAELLGEDAEVLEIGAGSGALAESLIAALLRHDRPPAAYRILEASPELAQRQRQRLSTAFPELIDRISWCEAPPAAFRGLVLANEVLDALPVERFQVEDGRASRLGVVSQEGGLAWSTRPDQTLETEVAALEIGLPDGARSELPRAYRAWVAEIADGLEAGALLFIDYGHVRQDYYAAVRPDGTLMCHHRHRAHDDPFFRPGLCDVTAWVEFTALAEAGTDAGLELAGFTSQAELLIALDLEAELADAFPGQDPVVQARVAQQVRWLTLPDEMGERFKAMAFTRGIDAPLAGFAGRDLRGTL